MIELTNTIKWAAAACVSIQTVGKALEHFQTNWFRDNIPFQPMMKMMWLRQPLNLSTWYAKHRDARGSFSQMADAAAWRQITQRMPRSAVQKKLLPALAWSDPKQMTIAGAKFQEANAELQSYQAGTPVSRCPSWWWTEQHFEQAPNLIQNIVDYLDVPSVRSEKTAADGELSAGCSQGSNLSAADH